MSVHPEIGRWFALSNVLRVGADIAVSKVDDIAPTAIKVVPDLEGFVIYIHIGTGFPQGAEK